MHAWDPSGPYKDIIHFKTTHTTYQTLRGPLLGPVPVLALTDGGLAWDLGGLIRFGKSPYNHDNVNSGRTLRAFWWLRLECEIVWRTPF